MKMISSNFLGKYCEPCLLNNVATVVTRKINEDRSSTFGSCVEINNIILIFALKRQFVNKYPNDYFVTL